jgi:hypothetical protein
VIRFLRWYTGLCLIGCVIFGVMFYDISMLPIGAGLMVLFIIYCIVMEDK